MAEPVGGSTRLPGRRLFLTGLAALPLALAGCQVVSSRSDSPQTDADSGAFPVSVTHAFGTTVISEEPMRIATLGLASADICLALGIVPTAMPLNRAQPNGSTPWFDFAWRGFGVELPLLLDEAKGLPVDDLWRIGPDLILAVNSKLTRAEYEELSQIAPVVAFPQTPRDIDWRTSLALVGKALGRSDAAARVRTETEQRMKAELGNYPDLAGTGFLVTKVRSAMGADFEVLGEESNPVRILKEFGLQTAPALALVKDAGRPVSASKTAPESYAWPQARAGELASDIAVFSLVRDEVDAVQASGVLDAVPAHKAGDSVIVDSASDGLALDAASCLSVSWLARTLVPDLAKAAYGAKQGA